MLKILTDVVPLVVFFLVYKYYGMLHATFSMLLVSISAILIHLLLKRNISKMFLLSTALISLSFIISVVSGNNNFIKMKPTILYMIFATIFFFTQFRVKPAVKYIMGETLILKDDKYWYQLNKRFIAFLCSMAVINEFIWRNFSESSWVSFKVFGVLTLTILFLLFQLPFFIKHKANDSKRY